MREVDAAAFSRDLFQILYHGLRVAVAAEIWWRWLEGFSDLLLVDEHEILGSSWVETRMHVIVVQTGNTVSRIPGGNLAAC